MADYGLLAGLAEGIKSGFQSYQDTKRYNDELARKKQAEERQAAQDAELLALKKREDERAQTKLDMDTLASREKSDVELAGKGLVGVRDDKGLLTGKYNKIPGFSSGKEIDPLEQRKKLAEIKKIEAETSRGKMLPSDKVLAIQEGAQIPTMLQDIKGTLESSKDMFGPIRGRIASANPYDEKAKTADAQIRTAAQAFGRFMEGGVLRKEDEEKYRRMFPSLSDTPEVAANKLAIVERLLAQKQAAGVQGLEASGYDVQGLSRPGLIPEVPKILTQQPKGLISNAVAAPKIQVPKAGTVEDGYRFKGGNPDDPKNWEKVK